MKSALINGFIGLVLSLFVSLHFFDGSVADVLRSVIVSNFAGMIALLVTLKLESFPWLRKHFLNHTLKTWSLLSVTYFMILFALAPSFQSYTHFFAMLLPLILSVGFGIILFGPIQDHFVRKQQKSALNPYLSNEAVHESVQSAHS